MWNSLRSIGISTLEIWQNLTVNLIGLVLDFSLSGDIICYGFKLFISSQFNFGRLYVHRNIHISSGFGGYTFSKHSFVFIWISLESAVIFLLSFLILLIWVFSLFLLVSLVKGLLILFTFSNNKQFYVWLIIYCSFMLHFFIFWPDPYYSCLVFWD